MPIAMPVEFPRRGDRGYAFEDAKTLATGLAQTLELEKKIDVLRDALGLGIAAEIAEIPREAKDDAPVEAHEATHGPDQGDGKVDAGRGSVEAHARRAADDAGSRHRFVDAVERFGVKNRIGIDEAENAAPRPGGAAVSRAGDLALHDVHDDATGLASDSCRLVRRGVVGDDDFDLTAGEASARDANGLEKPRQQCGFVECRNDE